MLTVKVVNRNANEVMEIVKELRLQGLQQGKDFDFAYNKPRYDPINGHFIENRYTIFTFYEDKYATLFALKYA